jgi:hypothetical protein
LAWIIHRLFLRLIPSPNQPVAHAFVPLRVI